MNRQQLPVLTAEAGLGLRAGEIRVAPRSERHEARNAREVSA